MSIDNSGNSQGQAPETPNRLRTGLLAGKVVVVSGIGPGLGRSIALEAAAAGANVVLAARTESRLKEVAEEIAAEGGAKTLCVATDITDDATVANLAKRTVETFGRVDALVNNAFKVPSMKPLARTDFEQIRESVDLTVLGNLRMTQAFTDALAETKGSVVMVNSMVLRHSEPRYGSYKIAKAALLAMSQTLATELGEKGIRVNSVLPGYIWTDQLKWYFGEIAKKYGITEEQVYQQTASKSDLKRLPLPDEIAQTIVFLMSPWANAITGQTIDVNCGEYHV
ncbi:SDR family oxidoreductase [Nocardia seriolae]|uniref:Trans-2-enoyl-CoA reductase (NADPH) n=1 Tax=Nocardia seriolae TaxID=37332 RepID=A0ABC8ATU0_9NOCA|nr:SDR family oxidoreductase [Nocardia seriolae]APA97332.1 Trans-2-enoyl-CoA reductase (NADPH) [Nocardia seriolae]PSK32779.1 SDR family NAD(P)-dependent oxidoreductase [Nocardia seriolae]QOW34317.1 SDR family oxidoreductase [Nocardia seriolae]QUN18226.1 SDR family oxidoreductase [Nocardia seriolae]WNJ61500.1 SDR family oxidoreductase [Nocardia seriolae]